MTLGFKTQGNIKYSYNDSLSIIEEIFNKLKQDPIFMSITAREYSNQCCVDTNMQKIEKEMDMYIKAHEDIQQMIVDVFAKRNIIIPKERATEKNESIDAKKKIIKEILNVK
jgi:hypothetical protein